MNGRIFVDTNILLYAYDKDAGSKREIAKTFLEKCWQDGNAVISAQVLCEFFVRATQN